MVQHGAIGLAETASLVSFAAGCWALARYREGHVHSSLDTLAPRGEAQHDSSDGRETPTR